MRARMIWLRATGAIFTAGVALGLGQAEAASGLSRISHIVVLYLENHSFDNLFGAFPGANGVAGAGGATLQRQRNGVPYPELPGILRPFHEGGNSAELYHVEAGPLPNRPFTIDGLHPSVTTATKTIDLAHAFYTNRGQIHGGANDLFVALAKENWLTMGYYSAAAMGNSKLWTAARSGVLFDNFFQGAFGGSFLNHMWLVCACAPIWPHPTDEQRSALDALGFPEEDRAVTAAADGNYAVNTILSEFLNDGPHNKYLLPGQSAVTIGDRLSERGVDWAWYSEGWDLAIKRPRTPQEDDQLRPMLFAYHHQPFAYFRRFDPATAQGRAERSTHLRDARNLEADISSGRLPPVSFYKPADSNSQHPGLGSIASGDAVVGQVMSMLENGPMRDSYALIITYDEYGGFFDHVAPPAGPAAGARADFFGPGTRIPAILVSPLAPHGKIDSTEYETTSVAKFITERFGLDPLPSPRFNAVKSLGDAFGFAD